jgi:hypothetical protein
MISDVMMVECTVNIQPCMERNRTNVLTSVCDLGEEEIIRKMEDFGFTARGAGFIGKRMKSFFSYDRTVVQYMIYVSIVLLGEKQGFDLHPRFSFPFTKE